MTTLTLLEKIFMGEVPGLTFVTDGAWVSTRSLSVTFNGEDRRRTRSRWCVSYVDGDTTYEAYGVDPVAAVLTLVAGRLGYHATVTRADG